MNVHLWYFGHSASCISAVAQTVFLTSGRQLCKCKQALWLCREPMHEVCVRANHSERAAFASSCSLILSSLVDKFVNHPAREREMHHTGRWAAFEHLSAMWTEGT